MEYKDGKPIQLISHKKYLSLGPATRRERKLGSSLRIGINSTAGGKGSRIIAGAGAQQGHKKGWIPQEEGDGNQETKKEAFKQVQNSRNAIHRGRG